MTVVPVSLFTFLTAYLTSFPFIQVKPKSDAYINGVKWLDRSQPSLLVCLGKDYKVLVYTIPSAPVFSWSPSGFLTVAVGTDSKLQEFSAKSSQLTSLSQEEQRKPQIEDIAKTIFERAHRNYGLDVCLLPNSMYLF